MSNCAISTSRQLGHALGTSGPDRVTPRPNEVQGTGLPFAQGVAVAGYDAVPAMTKAIARGVPPRGAPR